MSKSRTTPTRIYLVASSDTDWLVRATNASTAMRHVAGRQFKVEVAGQEKIVELLAKGAKVHTAGEAPENTEGAAS